ncbi:MAG: MFS transporter [Chloroflexi bacterium]|nr:MFS transporter [Chloroflexota bacterium]
MNSTTLAEAPTAGTAPPHAGMALLALILVAAVANLNLAVANVALPSIAAAFNASQTSLNLIAVGFALGLAASVLYFGALGDRYGRKLMLIAGTALAIPFSVLAAWSPNEDVLFVARVGTGLAAGMSFPTTLALITALWSGAGRTRSIALWSGIGSAIAALGPVASGFCLQHFWWGSVFLITVPLAVVALLLAPRLIPAHIHEGSEPVDNLGGVLSVVLVGTFILAVNFAVIPNAYVLVMALFAVAIASGIAFVIRQRRAANPLYDLTVARRRTFWVAACAGVIVFGSLTGAMFVGQQFLQNVLGYDTLQAGLAILPSAVCTVLVAPYSARLVEKQGARVTMLTGYVFVLLGFLTMLVLWKENASYLVVGLGYALVGTGVGFAGTPASHALTGSVPVTRVGMASGTADLQRDLGGAIMQSIFGALLVAGYATAANKAIQATGRAQEINDAVVTQLTKSYAGAETIAAQYPQYASGITAAAKASFLQGDQLAYLAGFVAVLIGGILVLFLFPKHAEEQAMLARFQREDAALLAAVGSHASSPQGATTAIGRHVPTPE